MIVSDRLHTLEPYDVGKRFDLPAGWTYLDWNESLFPPSPKVHEKISEYIEHGSLNRYPDISHANLTQKLSEYVDLPCDFVEVYSGSDDALKDIFIAFAWESKSVLSYQPSYSQVDTFIFANTKNYTRESIIDPMGKHEYDFSKIQDHDVVYLVNPNNPTGKLIDVDVIKNLLVKHPNTLFVVDEAYYEFCGETSANLVKSYENILITRTFSKAFGLASFRLGYVLGSPKTLRWIRKIKNGKSVSTLAQLAGEACLSDLDYLHRCVEKTKSATDFFVSRVNNMSGYKALQTNANFVLLRPPNPATFLQSMSDNKILVRDRTKMTGIEGCFRLNFGDINLAKRILHIMENTND